MKRYQKILSVLFALVLFLSVTSPVFADEAQPTAIDKAAFDALLAAGPVASDEVIASSAWATAVKNAGILRVGGTRTSFLFSQLDETDNGVRGFDVLRGHKRGAFIGDGGRKAGGGLV